MQAVASVQAAQSAQLQLQIRENERAAKTTAAEIDKVVEKMNSLQKSTAKSLATSLAKSPVRITKNSNKPTSGGSTAEDGGSTVEEGRCTVKEGGSTFEATTEMASKKLQYYACRYRFTRANVQS